MFPLVVVLQADIVDTGTERIVAPLALGAEIATLKSPLAPRVDIDGTTFVVITPRLIAIPAVDLASPVASLAPYRADLVAAIDYLFLGV
ncbi:MAG: CcdB family protein [Kofleriaceae bacterium]